MVPAKAIALPKPSCALTVAATALPAQASGPGKVTAKSVAPGTTVTAPWQEIALAASLAVMVSRPADRNWALKARVPASGAEKVAGPEITARPSFDVTVMVPVYPAAAFPKPSRTATRRPSCAPAAALAGRSSTLQVEAAAGETLKPPVPLRAWAASRAVTVCSPAVLRVTGKVCLPASAE